MAVTTARSRIELTLPFTCGTCRTSLEVRVIGRGSGAASSGPYGLDKSGARAEAREIAEQRADADARAAVGLVRCPRCRRANEGLRLVGWLLFWRDGLVAACLALVGMGVVLTALSAFGVDLEHGAAAPMVGTVAGAVAVGAPLLTMVGLHLRRIREVDAAAGIRA